MLDDDGIYKSQYEDYLLRNKVYQQHSLTLSTGGENSSTRLNLLYSKDLSDYTYNNADKYLLNFSNDYKVNDRINVGVSVNGIITNSQQNGSSVSEMKGITSPYTRLLEADGSYSYMTGGVYGPYLQNGRVNESEFPYLWRYNILEEARNRDNNSKDYNARLNGYLSVNVIDGLSFRVDANYELAGSSTQNFQREGLYNYRRTYNNFAVTIDPVTGMRTLPSGIKQGTWLQEGSTSMNAWQVRGQINFDKTFGAHRITAIAGAEATSRQFDNNGTSLRPGFEEDSYFMPTDINYTQRYMTLAGYESTVPWYLGRPTRQNDRFMSAYFNASYTLNEKYTIQGSARVDGSNYVAKSVNDKLSPFWSGGLAWNMHKEDFIKDNLGFVDYLTFKTTYGVGGNAAGRTSSSTLTTLSTWQLSAYTGNGETSSYISTKANPNLTWEKVYTFNVSADFSLFKGGLFGSVGYYNKITKDALMRTPTSYAITGYRDAYMNSGEISNKGIELNLGSTIKLTDNISWTGNMNLTYNKNEVLNWELDSQYTSSYTSGNTPIKGKPLNTVYAYNLAGYNDIGIAIVQLNDGSQVLADSRNNTMFYELFTNPLNLTLVDGTAYTRAANPDAMVTNDNNLTHEIGTLQAPWFGGFRNSFKVYDFTLSFIMTGEFGHIFNRYDDFGYNGTSVNFNKSLENAWRPGDDQNVFTYRALVDANNGPIMNAGALNLYYSNMIGASSSVWEDASRVRLTEVFLGYDIPVKKLFGANSTIKGANVYVQARNLGLVWAANDKGLDPSYLPGSIRAPRTYTFGLKLNI